MSGWILRADYAAKVEAAAAPLRAEGFAGRLGLVLGSGLGNFVDQLDVLRARDFASIEGFHGVGVAGHQGRLVHGRIDGEGELLVLQGRLHAYEGHSLEDVVFPVAVLLALGVEVLVLTNAAGGCHPDARAGDLVALTGLLDAHGDALRGLLLPPPGVPAELALRGITHNGPFDRALALRLVDVGAKAGIPVATGTYASLWGPSYETPREIGYYRSCGAAAIGMSTGPEAAYARRMGAKVVGVSCITNVAREHGVEEVSHEEVMAVGAARREDFARLLSAFAADVLAS
jgi:purine-nucleoside phosphorylase